MIPVTLCIFFFRGLHGSETTTQFVDVMDPIHPDFGGILKSSFLTVSRPSQRRGAWLRICIGPHWMSNTTGAASFWKAQLQRFIGSDPILLALPLWILKTFDRVGQPPYSWAWNYIFVGCIIVSNCHFWGGTCSPSLPSLENPSRSHRTTMRRPGINISAARRPRGPRGAWVMLLELMSATEAAKHKWFGMGVLFFQGCYSSQGLWVCFWYGSRGAVLPGPDRCAACRAAEGPGLVGVSQCCTWFSRNHMKQPWK